MGKNDITFESFRYDLEVLMHSGWQRIVSNGEQGYVFELYKKQKMLTPHVRIIETHTISRIMKPYEAR